MTAEPRPVHLQPGPLMAVFVGGFVGTAARAGVETAFPHTNGSMPWATFAINVAGCLLLGFLLEGLVRLGPDDQWRRRARLFLGTGFCGAFTTYSALAGDARTLLAAGHVAAAAAYVVGTLMLGLCAAAMGFALAGRIRSS